MVIRVLLLSLVICLILTGACTPSTPSPPSSIEPKSTSTPSPPAPEPKPEPVPVPNPPMPAPKPMPTPTLPPIRVEVGALRALAHDLNIDFGTSVRVWGGAEGDSLYMDTVPQHFNLVVLGGVMNMVSTQPQNGVWDFNQTDRMVEYAESNNMKIRWQSFIYGHPLNRTGDWHPTPEWIRAGNFTREEMINIMNDHIATVMNRYGTRIDVWVVVNEPLTGEGLKECVWTDKIGEDYVELAFQMAREYAPDALLCLNEHSADYTGQCTSGKQDLFYDYVKELVGKGVPIDAVGLQFHLAVPEYRYRTEPTVDKIVSNFKRYGDLGLDVLITELDVRIKEPITQEKLERQAEVYAMVIEAALKSDNCKSITVWGYTDKYSWNPDSDYSAPCMFDEYFKPKPAYYSVIEVMENHLK